MISLDYPWTMDIISVYLIFHKSIENYIEVKVRHFDPEKLSKILKSIITYKNIFINN